MTAAMRAGRPAPRIAPMLLPRPEINMTMRFSAISRVHRLEIRQASVVSSEKGEGHPAVPVALPSLEDSDLGSVLLAFDDAPDAPRGFARGLERLQRRVDVAGADDDHHADAAVEHAVEFRVGDIALVLEPAEQRRQRPCSALDARGEAFREHARHILDEAATGDVGEALDRDGLHELKYRLHVDPRRLQDDIAQRPAVEAG